MISFKYRSIVKRIKIKTNKKLDQRMSHWLQGVFGIKNSIIGFKTSQSIFKQLISFLDQYYDVESFYFQKQKFYDEQVQIVEANDQLQISFTSDNLNSSSFIRPSQPNTSQINQKVSSQDQQIRFINDTKSFERSYLSQGKDINILFDINSCFKKILTESLMEIGTYNSFKINYFVFLNSKPKSSSTFRMYIGKTLVATHNFTKDYKNIILSAAKKYKKSRTLAQRQTKVQYQVRASYQQQFQDEAPSFTTYHLQQRINQQTCQEYLLKMYKEKLLRHYQYVKMIERCQDNFSEFYKIFCDGIFDNDYESFKNEMLGKVDNNLELLLSNVDQMDFSRPISRQQQRKNLKKSVPNIEIVKVQNYFEILDGLNDILESEDKNQLKQYLLDQNQEVCENFATFLARDISKIDLQKNLKNFLDKQGGIQRPHSRCVPRSTQKSRSAEPTSKRVSQTPPPPQLKQNYNNLVIGQEISLIRPSASSDFNEQIQPIKQLIAQQQILNNESTQPPPMFGPSNSSNFSPIKYMSDIDSNYKQAWSRLQSKANSFSAEEYGLLYHYLQTRDDSISNIIQQIQWDDQKSLDKLKTWLRNKMKSLLQAHFSDRQIQFINQLKDSPESAPIFENFRYESDIQVFIQALRQELNKNRPLAARILHKKSSDSQLIAKKQRKYGKRRYSDQEPQGFSPPHSQISLYQQTSQSNLKNLMILHNPWSEQFQQMLGYCNFTQDKKQQYLRQAFKAGHPSVYVWIRNYLSNKHKIIDIEQLKKTLKMKDSQSKFLIKIVPILNQLMKCMVDQGKLSNRIRKWVLGQFIEINLSVIGSFQLYLQTKNEEEFIENLRLTYELQNSQMEFYKIYQKRIENLFKAMAVQDQISSQIFRLYPKMIQGICEAYYFTGDTQELLDTLHTLHSVETQRRKLNVATLNFSGINFNPFEYDDGSQELSNLNSIFKTILTQKNNDNVGAFQFGKLAKEFKIGRLSLMYNKTIPQIDGKLANQQQFKILWYKQFQNANINTKELNINNKLIQNLMIFDLTMYQTIIRYVYQEKSLENVKNLDKNKIQEYMNNKNLDPMNYIDHKRVMLLKYIFESNIDVMFIQEAQLTQFNQMLPKKYSFVKNADSVIIWNKEKLGNAKSSLNHIYSEQLNINQDSVCMFTDRGYLFVSSHLKSDKRHIQQAKQLFQTLDIILQDHPMLKIIVGIDANHFLQEKAGKGGNSKSKFKIIPTNKQSITTRKKRTYMQQQPHKANIVMKNTIDHLISNIPFSEYEVQDIQRNTQPDQFIPHYTHHPYDHFIVRARLEAPIKYTFIPQSGKLNVATLNFSGINLSPFEYDDGSQQKKNINAIFKQNLNKLKGQSFSKFDIGKIDKQFQQGRLCVCYSANNVPIIEGKLASKQQFEKLWFERYANMSQQTKIILKASQQEKKNCCQMDFLFYQTLAMHIYGLKNLQAIKQVNPQAFINYISKRLIPQHEYLKIKRRLAEQYLFKYNIDVMFIQEGADLQDQWKRELDQMVQQRKKHHEDGQLPIYGIGNNNPEIDSFIIYNRRKLGNPITYFNDLYSDKLNFNKDSDFLITENGYFIASVHLKSKKEIYIEQTKNMMKQLKILEKQNNLQMIIGIDANHFIGQQFKDEFNIVPRKEDIPTVKKKRTYLQAQLQKAELQDQSVKDHLICTAEIVQYYVQDINGNKINQQSFIPNQNHPYDHYVVRGIIQS